ncbi:MAG TPA: Clp protease N-terminal domain-containing protein, partial [Trichormus sp.]
MVRKHEFLTLEHVLFALLQDKTTAEVVRNCGGDVNWLKQELDKFMNDNIEKIRYDGNRIPEQTAAFERVFNRAVLQAESSGQPAIDGGNLLAAMFQERRSHAVFLLEKQGISRLDVLNYISHGISKISPGIGSGAPDGSMEPEGADTAPT